MTAFQAFQLEDLEREQSESGKPYLEFLRRRGMLRVRDHDVAVGPGSVVSVDHGEDHRFVDIAEDLLLVVVFAPPESPDDE